MTALHTPGPWHLIGKQGTAIWAGNSIIANVEGARAFHRIARANAQLIASAPELLEFAQQLAARGIADKPTMQKCRAAIAKATGAAA